MQEKSSPKFAENLARAMMLAGVKQARLADLSGFSKGYVSSLLSGSRENPSPETVAKFAQVLRVSPEQLIYGYDPDPPTAMLGESPPIYKVRDKGESIPTESQPQEPTLADAFAKLHEALDMLKAIMERGGPH